MLTPFFICQKTKILQKIDPAMVMCLYTTKNYTKIFLSNKKFYEVRTSQAAALKKLPKGMFIKTDRKTVVSIFYIDYIAKDHFILGEESLPISLQFYKSAITKLNIIG